MRIAIPRPLQSTFTLLSAPENQAAFDVLLYAVRHTSPDTQLRAIDAALRRKNSSEVSRLLECIDWENDEQVLVLQKYRSLVQDAAEDLLASKNDSLRQMALIAIAKLKLYELFLPLIQVAETPDDSQQIVAIQLLDSLSTDLGREARQSIHPPTSSERIQLQNDLNDAVIRYPFHRVGAILDCWILATHWEDTSFRSLFSPIATPTSETLLRRLKTLTRIEADELLCGAYWCKISNVQNLELLASRPAEQVFTTLCALERRFGITPVFSRNESLAPLSMFLANQLAVAPTSTTAITAAHDASHSQDSDLSLEQTCSVLRLLAVTHAPQEIVLAKVVAAISKYADELPIPLSNACVQAIRSLTRGTDRPVNSPVICMVLSDTFGEIDTLPYEAPAWRSTLRESLVELLTIYPTTTQILRKSIEELFVEFTCEQLFQIVDSWSEAHLLAFAQVTHVMDPSLQSTLESGIHSPVPERRRRSQLVRELLIKYVRSTTRPASIASTSFQSAAPSASSGVLS